MNKLPGIFVSLILLLSLSLPLIAEAQRADAGAVAIGRLFLSPAERTRIDSQRARGVADDTTVQTEQPATLANQIVVNGWVKRGDGVDAVWVNGTAVTTDDNGTARGTTGNNTAGDLVILRGPDRENRVVIGRSNGKRAAIKPGQAWNLLNDEVEECADCVVQETAPAIPEAEGDAETAVAGS